MTFLRALIFSIVLSSTSAVFSDCQKPYKKQLEQGAVNATASYLTIVGIPVGVYNSYIAHQSRKMVELIGEAKNRRIGKRTKGLFKSLNGIYTTGEVHKKVLENNKVGKLCKKVWNPQIRDTEWKVMTYRDFKNSLRFEIDRNLLMKGKPPIWNDPEDIR